MTHYVNIFPFLLILASLFLKDRRIFNPKTTFFSFLFLLIGLLPLIIIPITASMNSFINWGGVQSFETFLRFILRAEYQGVGSGEVNNFNPSQFLLRDLPYYFYILFSSFTILL